MKFKDGLRHRLAQRLVQTWYDQRFHFLTLLLLPLSWLFSLIIRARKFGYTQGWLSSYRAALPTIIVGNITVGGTGKTPLVIALVELLKKNGFKPGIISRGYGGRDVNMKPQYVTPTSDPSIVGDEPLMLAQRCTCPIVVSRNRSAAAQTLVDENICDILISDDGLQHYALSRDIEIAVLDGQRRLGNGHLLPAGPLRETKHRLKTVDFIVVNEGAAKPGEHSMYLLNQTAINLATGELRLLSEFATVPIIAMAGIGNPNRFFNSLRSHKLYVTEYPFPDHFKYQESDLNFTGEGPVFMTEKDAVKCRRIISTDRYWYVPVQAQIDANFAQSLMKMVYALR